MERGGDDAGIWRQTGRVSSDTLCSQFSDSGTRFKWYRRALTEVDEMREFGEDPMRESWTRKSAMNIESGKTYGWR